MHVKSLTFLDHEFPTNQHYPFNIESFHRTGTLRLDSPITFFIGENGTGKSTLLEAMALKCGVHIWRMNPRSRVEDNPYEDKLYRYIRVEWTNGIVPGSFFASEIFKDFSRNLEEWAVSDLKMLRYFGGKSLLTQSHGQSTMAFFRSRYRIKGIYFLDEPETALSPKTQLNMVRLLREMGQAGHAQFMIATHSPILLACPGATIYSMDHIPIKKVSYEQTEYYRLYRDFMENRQKYLTGDEGTET